MITHEEFRQMLIDHYGGWDAYLRHCEQSQRDSQFLSDHMSAWRLKYPNQYVAVYKEKLVGVNSDDHELVASLQQRGLPVGDGVKIEFLEYPRPVRIGDAIRVAPPAGD